MWNKIYGAVMASILTIVVAVALTPGSAMAASTDQGTQPTTSSVQKKTTEANAHMQGQMGEMVKGKMPEHMMNQMMNEKKAGAPGETTAKMSSEAKTTAPGTTKNDVSGQAKAGMSKTPVPDTPHPR